MNRKQLPAVIGLALAGALLSFPPPAAAANPPAKAAPEPAKTAAPAETRQLSPAELAQFVRTNNNKLRRLIQDLENTCRNGRQLRDKLPGKARETAKEILALAAIPEKEGRPDSMTPSMVRLRIGEAFCHPLNLRLVKEARSFHAEALRLATTPEEKAEARYAIASLAFRTAGPEELAERQKGFVACHDDTGLPARRRVELLARAVESGLLPDVDFLEFGWKIAKDDPKAHELFYERSIRLLMLARRRPDSCLEDRYGEAKTIECCDKAIKDPAIRNKRYFVETKANTLADMRRFAEAEQFLLDKAATTNAPLRHDYSIFLGKFYERMAERYYDDPERSLMEKAIAAYHDAQLADPRDSAPPRMIAETAARIGDYDRTIAAYQDVIDLRRHTDRWVSIRLGEAYYGKKDWEAAADCYGKQARFLPQPDRMKYCRALFVLGRYEEAIENLKLYESKGYAAQKDEARFFIRKVEERLAAQKAKD